MTVADKLKVFSDESGEVSSASACKATDLPQLAIRRGTQRETSVDPADIANQRWMP
jgi:hypothetical protein